ncbi:hypothetical protein GGR30_000564 [Martelella radicis]|uniref:Uncharacterized protein n=1 Tax=Martelella radicis TaxID=1397476 RepID=A0A7W6P9L9_9HYPH|nr:hypothetical protein [Martelella radicis]
MFELESKFGSCPGLREEAEAQSVGAKHPERTPNRIYAPGFLLARHLGTTA